MIKRLNDAENAKITDPELMKKQLELGEHIKKGSSVYICLRRASSTGHWSLNCPTDGQRSLP